MTRKIILLFVGLLSMCIVLCVIIVMFISSFVFSSDTDLLDSDFIVFEPPATEDYNSDVLMELSKLARIENDEMRLKMEGAIEVNKDVVGWINCDDLKIDYPVLYSEDNKEYLRKNVYGEYDVQGSIYLDANYGDSKSPIRLVHGHNMANKTMFAHLPELLRMDTLDSTEVIGYYDAEFGYKEYKIFSVFSVNAKEESMIISDYKNINRINSLKQEYYDRSWVACSEVPSSIELLMLNTCWYGKSGEEHFLHCITVAGRIK